MRGWCAGLTVAVMAAMPIAAAQAADSVTAYNPGGIATALRDAGNSATLEVDDYGDPMIKTKFGDYNGAIYFYGCDEKTHDRCESVQLRAGLDRKSPMPLTLLNTVAKKYRYSAMWLDDDGDPWVNFDIITADGIPKSVFMLAVKNYSDTLEDVAAMVFEEERKK